MRSQVKVARDYETRIAEMLGGKRMAKKHYGHSIYDIETDYFVGECKLRKKLAIETWIQQVERFGRGKIPIVISKVKGKRDSYSLVTMRITDFIKLIEGKVMEDAE